MSDESSAPKVEPHVPGISGRDLQFILESAILAPSADNHHRIRFTCTGNVLSIHGTEPDRTAGRSYRRVLSLLSVGAVVENMAVAANRFGFGVDVALLPETSQPSIAQIRFKPGAPNPDLAELWRVLALRHTNRSLRFRGPALTSSERARLGSAIQCFPRCALMWLDRPQCRRPILALMREAEGERFRNRLLHNEMFSSIRFEAGWRSSTPEGLPPGALGIEAPLRPLFAALRHWPIMRAANALGAHRMLGLRAAALPGRLAPDMLLITVKATDDDAIFEAGRGLQRTWLGLTKLGRVAQPLPSAALYALPEACDDGIPGPLQRRLADGWRSHVPDAIPLVAMRIGHARVSRVVAGRPPVERFWID